MKRDTVIIHNDKIYTSYFARASKIVPNRRLVSIALSSPESWEGTYLRELNPSPMLIHNIKNGLITTEEYRKEYIASILNQLNPNEIADKLKGKVACCWEKTGSFCHRVLVIEWLASNLGNDIIGGEI